MLDWPELILDLNAKKVAERWDMLARWLQENAPFTYFAEETGCFALDARAKKMGHPVLACRQRHPFPKTPLPEMENGLPSLPR
jgi:hypothetical protein